MTRAKKRAWIYPSVTIEMFIFSTNFWYYIMLSYDEYASRDSGRFGALSFPLGVWSPPGRVFRIAPVLVTTSALSSV